MTYPNQKIIHINKKTYSSQFLQIGIKEWQDAYKALKPASFAIYLYLASNANGFDLALSKQAIENILGIKKTAYYTALEELEEQGFIVKKQGNIYNFYTAAVRKNGKSAEKEEKDFSAKTEKNSAKTEILSAKTDVEVRKNGIEIDNIDIINKINNREKIEKEEIKIVGKEEKTNTAATAAEMVKHFDSLINLSFEDDKPASTQDKETEEWFDECAEEDNSAAVPAEPISFTGNRQDLIFYTRKNYPAIDKDYCQKLKEMAFPSEERMQKLLINCYAEAGFRLNWNFQQ